MVYRLRTGVARSTWLTDTLKTVGNITLIVLVALVFYITLFHPDIIMAGLK